MEQKTYVLFFFFFYFQLQSLFPFFSGVLVNGHLYVNMKNQDQVLIDGLLENHVGLAFVWERRTREILPWLSFNLLISRLSTSLCMVSGRCCISLKTKKAGREDSYCVIKKKYLLILFLTNGYLAEENSKLDPSTEADSFLTPLTRACVCWLQRHGSLSAAQSAQRRRDTWHNMDSRFGGWIDSRWPRRTFNVENRCKRKTCSL